MKEPLPQFNQRLTTAQIEECLVHILRDPELFQYARQNLRPSDFSPLGEMQYVLVWLSALNAAERNGGTLPVQGFEACIQAEFRAVCEAATASGDATPEAIKNAESLLWFIFNRPKEQLNPPYFRELIQDLVIEKTVIPKLNETAKQAREIGRQLDLPERLEQAAARIREVKQPVKSLGNVRDGWADFQIRLQRYRGREFLGLRTGLRQLDDRTLGLRGLILLGAAPNVGKTALVLHLGINIIRENPDACFLFVSLEMDQPSLLTRIYCNLAEMDWATLVRGEKSLRAGSGPYFTPDQQARLQTADDWIARNGHRIRVHDRQSFGDRVSAAQILREMSALKTQSGTARAFVVIDYLQMIPIPDTVRRVTELDIDKYQLRVAQDILAGMRQNESALLGDAVVAISETRKPSGGRGHWGEDLADLMGSARLGYGADAVLLYRRVTEEERLGEIYEAQGRVPTIEELENEGIVPIMLAVRTAPAKRGEDPVLGTAHEPHDDRDLFF